MALQEYLYLQEEVTQLLKALGTQFQLVRPTKNNLGVVVNQTFISNVFGSMDEQLAGYFPTTAGGVIAVQTKVMYLSWFGPGFGDPEVGDILINGSISWRVISVEVYRPDGQTTISYTCKVT